LFLESFPFRFGELLVQIGEALCGDVGFVVDAPNLVLPLVINACVFRLFYGEFQLVELIGEKPRGLQRRFVAALDVLGLEIVEMRVENAGRQNGIGGFVAHLHQVAGGHTLDA